VKQDSQPINSLIPQFHKQRIKFVAVCYSAVLRELL